MNRPLTLTAATIVILLVPGCPRGPWWKGDRSGDPLRARTAAVEPELQVLAGPAEGSALEQGNFELRVQVVGAPLDENDPFLLRVSDLASDLSYELDAARMRRRGFQFTVDPEAARLDLEGLRVGEGERRVELAVRLANGGVLTHAVTVVGLPRFPESPYSDVLAARAQYTAEVLSILESYSTFIESLIVDSTAFPYVEYDRGLLAEVTDLIRDTFGEHPNGAGWLGRWREFETELGTLNTAHPPLSAEETVFRARLMSNVEEAGLSLADASDLLAAMNVQRAGTPAGSGPYQVRLDHYSNLSASISSEDLGTTRTWQARIHANQGTPHSFTFGRDYVSQVVPSSGEAQPPVFDLEVRVFDTDADGDFDDLVFEGLVHDPLTSFDAEEALVPATDTAVDGHLTSPLRLMALNWFLRG